jgi:hypothetical protein
MIGIRFGCLQEVYVVRHELDCAGIPPFFYLASRTLIFVGLAGSASANVYLFL